MYRMYTVYKHTHIVFLCVKVVPTQYHLLIIHLLYHGNTIFFGCGNMLKPPFFSTSIIMFYEGFVLHAYV